MRRIAVATVVFTLMLVRLTDSYTTRAPRWLTMTMSACSLKPNLDSFLWSPIWSPIANKDVPEKEENPWYL